MVCDEPVAVIRSEPFPKMKFVPAKDRNSEEEDTENFEVRNKCVKLEEEVANLSEENTNKDKIIDILVGKLAETFNVLNRVKSCGTILNENTKNISKSSAHIFLIMKFTLDPCYICT